MKNAKIICLVAAALVTFVSEAWTYGRTSTNGSVRVALIAEGCLDNGMVVTRRTVTDAVSAAGFVPLVLPNIADTNQVEAILDRVDALVVFGALNKQNYRRRSAFELPLIRRAAARNIPVVGFCHGHQQINRAFGGEVSRNPTNVAVKVVHHGKENPYVKDCFHEVTVKPGTLLAKTLGEGRQIVNSSHDFSISKLADGFTATATSDDGVIEAIEHRTLPVYGFQFHPERIASVRHDPRFVKIVKAALEGGREFALPQKVQKQAERPVSVR